MYQHQGYASNTLSIQDHEVERYLKALCVVLGKRRIKRENVAEELQIFLDEPKKLDYTSYTKVISKGVQLGLLKEESASVQSVHGGSSYGNYVFLVGDFSLDPLCPGSR